MKTLLKRVALLALAVLAIVFLHGRVKQEMAEAAAKEQAADETGQPADEADTQSMSVLRLGEGSSLGTVAENPDGGVIITVTNTDGTQTAYTFTDVAVDSWYAGAVNFAVSTGLMTGSDVPDCFQPEFGMPRESFATLLYRYTNGVPVEAHTHFDDVKAENWFYDAVSWVTNEHLMTGVDASTFGVGSYLTCEQALIGLYRVAGEPETDGTLTDYPYAAKVSESGRSAIDWAWKSGLITEDECVWYPPQAISRAQVALLLMRYSAMVS